MRTLAGGTISHLSPPGRDLICSFTVECRPSLQIHEWKFFWRFSLGECFGDSQSKSFTLVYKTTSNKSSYYNARFGFAITFFVGCIFTLFAKAKAAAIPIISALSVDSPFFGKKSLRLFSLQSFWNLF